MNFLEIAIFIGLVFLLYFFLSPVQRRLEWKIYKIFRKTKNKNDTIVDITDTIKKENKNGKL
jgi:hypothetical protein